MILFLCMFLLGSSFSLIVVTDGTTQDLALTLLPASNSGPSQTPITPEEDTVSPDSEEDMSTEEYVASSDEEVTFASTVLVEMSSENNRRVD